LTPEILEHITRTAEVYLIDILMQVVSHFNIESTILHLEISNGKLFWENDIEIFQEN